MLLNNLGEKYSLFVHRIVALRDDILDFDKVVTILYEEDRLLKSDKHNITIVVVKRDKSSSTSSKGNSRGGNNSRGGRGGRNSSNTIGDRYSKNPNSTNFKGEGKPPKYKRYLPNSKGNLKKH